MNRLLLRGVTVVVYLMLSLFFQARASAETGARSVVVLRPSSGAVEPWPEGTQAVVAELSAGGYELAQRASTAQNRDDLLTELAEAVSDDGVLGAVVVARDGDRGIAYVCTREDGAVRVEAGVSEGAVGEGALALRITQLLGPPRLDVPPPREAEPPPPPPLVKPPEHEHDAGLLLALDIGLAWSSDLDEPLPVLGLDVRKSLFGSLSLDASGYVALGASRLESPAGTVDVRAQGLALHASFDPFRGKTFGLSLGLGGGVVWVRGEGEAKSGFDATDESTHVALLSARASAFFRRGPVSLLASVEPGVMLPPVSVALGGEVSRLGRPWTRASVGLGWNL